MEYYELDGALFRTLKPEFVGVQEVWTGQHWVKYTGDGFKPWAQGMKIAESKLPVAARGDRT
jgi:hypothetical protein